MIKLVFTINREVFTIQINNKTIWYSDRKWKKPVKIIPKDEGFAKMVLMSRNKITKEMAKSITDLFSLTEEEQKEYDSANTDDELADICIKDVKKKGAILLRRENDSI